MTEDSIASKLCLGLMLVLLFALGNYCLVESISDGVWKRVNVVVSVDFYCFLGGIAYHEAVMAPLEMLFQLRFKLDVNIAVQILVEFLKKVFAFHCGLAPSLLLFLK